MRNLLFYICSAIMIVGCYSTVQTQKNKETSYQIVKDNKIEEKNNINYITSEPNLNYEDPLITFACVLLTVMSILLLSKFIKPRKRENDVRN